MTKNFDPNANRDEKEHLERCLNPDLVILCRLDEIAKNFENLFLCLKTMRDDFCNGAINFIEYPQLCDPEKYYAAFLILCEETVAFFENSATAAFFENCTLDRRYKKAYHMIDQYNNRDSFKNNPDLFYEHLQDIRC